MKTALRICVKSKRNDRRYGIPVIFKPRPRGGVFSNREDLLIATARPFRTSQRRKKTIFNICEAVDFTLSPGSNHTIRARYTWQSRCSGGPW